MMQSGEAQVNGASQQNSSAVLKGVGKKGSKMSLIQMLFGKVTVGGSKIKPFGKVLGQMQGKKAILGKSQSRLPASLHSGLKPNGGKPAKATTGKGVGEAAMLLKSGGEKVMPSASGQVAPAPPHGRAKAGTLGGSLPRTSQPTEKKTLASNVDAKGASDETAMLALSAISGKVTPKVVVDAGAKLKSDSSDGIPSDLKSVGAESTPKVQPKGHAYIRPNVKPSPKGEVVASRLPEATNTAKANSVKISPNSVGQTPKQAQNDANSPPVSTPAKAVVSSSEVSKPSIAAVNVDQSLDADSTPKTVESTGKGGKVEQGTRGNQAGDSKALSTPESTLRASTKPTQPQGQPIRPQDGAKQQVDRPAVVAVKAEQATAQPVGPLDSAIQQVKSGSEPGTQAANVAAIVDGGNNGDSKRLEVRSGKSKRSNITFVEKSDPGQNLRPSDAAKGVEQRVDDIRSAGQTQDGRSQVGNRASLANLEPSNSLTAEDLTITSGAGNGSEGFKIAKPAEIGLQGQVDSMGREIHVPTAQTPHLTQTSGDVPGLANLAKMTVHHFTRFVNGNQNQNVFQVDGGPLGNVKITFSDSDGGSTLSIVVDSPEAQQQLQRALPQLQQQWGNQNLNFGQVNVQVGNSKQDTAFNGEGSHPNSPEEQSMEDLDVPIAMSMERIVNYGYNTVEYVA